MKRLSLVLLSCSTALQGPPRVTSCTRRPATDDAAEVPAVIDDETLERELPIDFGSSGTQWTFEWPAVGDEPWSVRTWPAAALCSRRAILHQARSARPSPCASRARARSSRRRRRCRAEGRLARGVSDAFDASQTIPVAKIGDTPWWGVALGASVPTIQIVLVPLLLSAPEGAFSCSASQLPNLADAAEKLAIAPLTEGLVFQFWALEACRRAGLPYAPSVLGAGLAFGAWHGVSPNSLFLAALGAYWGHPTRRRGARWCRCRCTVAPVHAWGGGVRG